MAVEELKSKIFYCYKIKNMINNKLYIGITKDFKQRRRQHICVSTTTTDPQYNHRLYRSIRKHGFDSFVFTIIKTMDTWAKIAQYEIDLIAKLDTMNEDKGYNLSKGGEGAYGAVRSPETRAKLSAIAKKQMTPEAKAHLSHISKENWKDPAYRKKFEKGVKKKKQTYNLSGLKKFYKKNPNAYAKHATKKPCIYNGVKYCSIAEAARQNNTSESTVRRKVRLMEIENENN